MHTFKNFWLNVNIPDNDQFYEECWEWTGMLNDAGYGIYKGKRAHRFAFILTKGIIKNGCILRHICDNKSCVNPTHLLEGTVKDNTLDMVRRNSKQVLHGKGELHKLCKLTDVQV